MHDTTEIHNKNKVSSVYQYYGVAAALYMMNIVTVTVSQFNLGQWNLVVALGIAMLKAILVALFFMHLLHDNRFYLVVFISSIVFVAIFIIFILFDTMRRTDIYEEVGRPIDEKAVIYEVGDDSSRITNDGLKK